MDRYARSRVIAALGLAASLGMACVGVGVENYEEFRGAVDSGASCKQLFEIAGNFEGQTRARIDGDLREIGCTDANAERTDR